MPFIYSTGTFLMSGGIRLLGSVRVEGREMVPSSGPLLIVANHQSNIDPPLIAASLPRRIYFMAKQGMFRNPPVAAVLKAYGVFPINRDGTDLAAVQWALRTLKSGASIILFPEGTRSPGAMRQALPGVAMIALRSGAPILPVGITGSERVGALWKISLPRAEFRVKIGRPFNLPSSQGKLGREQLETTTTSIMERVAALLPESYRGVYSLEQSEASPG